MWQRNVRLQVDLPVRPYVAGLNGISAEAMGTSIEKLNKSIFAAAAAPAGAVNAFTRLGVSLKDTQGKLKDGLFRTGDPKFEKKLTGQPRQNVLFEAGIAFGKYKDTTILVQIGKVRPMSDVSGIHVVHLTGSVASRRQLIGKLKTTGVKADDSGQDWLDAGDFSKF